MLEHTEERPTSAPALRRSRSGFAGVYPILYAFFAADGRLDRAAMQAQVDSCIACGAAGIAVLGLVTEVHKLDTAERREIVDVVAEAIGRRVPLAVTVAEQSARGQIAFVRAAEAAGAAWVILQPPAAKGYAEAEYLRFLGTVAEQARVPVAIQNNPTNLDVALSNQGLIALNRNHPNIALLKGEGPAINVARLIEESDGAFDVFCGHGGKELPTNLRSGCVGLIPAPDMFDVQVRIMALLASGSTADAAEAERLHREILPLITFMLQSIPILLAYGKRLTARRLGLGEIHERPPSLATTAFGRDEVARMSRMLGSFPGRDARARA
jgi:4-hydroxy-tetrahydrodipicolinate synthase